MSDSMNEPATRAEFREEVAKLATKAELREEVAKLATKADLHSALEIWAGALREQLKADAQQREDRLTAHVSTEIARHVGAILERTQTEIGVVDEKYRDIPPRLTNVEALAHTHTEPPPKKATGRRSR